MACGLSSRQIHYRLGTGRYDQLGQRVLRVAGAPATWEQQLMAGLLEGGRGAVVSHRSAAALHGFDGFGSGPVELTVPRARRGLDSPRKIHTTLRLDMIDRAKVGGFPCTSASRTIVDLAATASAGEVERAIDSAVRDGLTSPAFLRRRLSRLRGPGRRGVRLLDELLVDSGGHSDLERRFLALVRRAGLPRPTAQRTVRQGRRTIARADFSFEPLMVLAEVSGRRGHSSDAERAKDARRRNELQHEGFVVLEFTNDQVRRHPGYVETTLRRHLT